MRILLTRQSIPAGRGARLLPRLLLLCSAMFVPGCAPDAEAEAGARVTLGSTGPEPSDVRPGIEVLLADSLHLVAGRRVGLITNHTGVDASGRPSIDLLFDHPDVELEALFSPEHGIRGQIEAGVRVGDATDSRTGLPVHSLYGATRKPTPEMLAGLDVLLFDIQDVGARYYTYVSTMALGMEAAGEAGLSFVVLDRPNPIGGALVQGNVLDPAFATFVGMYPVPMRHGMTPGELASMYVGEFGLSVELHVVPADGWTRNQAFEDTSLPWIAPSPNMPSVESALHYPGTCLFEGTNLSVARGTDAAFQMVGAPWLDGDDLADRLNGYGLRDVRFEPVQFTPSSPGDGKYDGELVQGVRLVEVGPAYDPTRAAVAMLIETRAASGGRWQWRESHFDRLAGTDALRLGIAGESAHDELVRAWDGQLSEFNAQRKPYLLYP